MQSVDVDVAAGVRLRVRHWGLGFGRGPAAAWRPNPWPGWDGPEGRPAAWRPNPWPGLGFGPEGRPAAWRPNPGQGAGRPFLLVHGLSSNARLWDGVAARLGGAGHPVYAVDLRSHGESDAPPDGYDTSTAADDLAALCARLGLARPVVAGQSWGGNVVVRLAARQPELVGRAGPGRRRLDRPDRDVRQLGAVRRRRCDRPRSTGGRPPRCGRYLRRGPPGLVRRTRSRPPWPTCASEPDGTVPAPAVDPAPHADRAQHVGATRRGPTSPDHGAGAAAAGHRRRAGGDGRSARWSTKAAGALPGARIQEYVGGDHDLHAQHPDAVAADLLTLAAGGPDARPAGHHGLRRDRADHGQAAPGHLRAGRRPAGRAARYAVRLPVQRGRHLRPGPSATSPPASGRTVTVVNWRTAPPPGLARERALARAARRRLGLRRPGLAHLRAAPVAGHPGARRAGRRAGPRRRGRVRQRGRADPGLAHRAGVRDLQGRHRPVLGAGPRPGRAGRAACRRW